MNSSSRRRRSLGSASTSRMRSRGPQGRYACGDLFEKTSCFQTQDQPAIARRPVAFAKQPRQNLFVRPASCALSSPGQKKGFYRALSLDLEAVARRQNEVLAQALKG